MVTTQQNGSTLMHLLPAIYREADAHHDPTKAPLATLLEAFESVLLHSKSEGAGELSIGEKIAAIPDLFRPVQAPEAEGKTPREFLPWLAQFAALKPEVIELFLGDPDSRADDAASQEAERAFRTVVASIVPMYGRRGTRSFLKDALCLFIPEVRWIGIDDRDLPGLTVGKSEVGKSSWLVTYRPFHFSMTIRFDAPDGDDEQIMQRRRLLRHKAETIIELSRPAHTTYNVHWDFG